MDILPHLVYTIFRSIFDNTSDMQCNNIRNIPSYPVLHPVGNIHPIRHIANNPKFLHPDLRNPFKNRHSIRIVILRTAIRDKLHNRK